MTPITLRKDEEDEEDDDRSKSTIIMLHLILIVDHLEDDLCHEIGHSEGSAASQSHPQN